MSPRRRFRQFGCNSAAPSVRRGTESHNRFPLLVPECGPHIIFAMEADIWVSNSTSIWVESTDNDSFTIAAKVPPGKPDMVTPIGRLELRIMAEDLAAGASVRILHLRFTPSEAKALGERLLAVALRQW